MARAKANLNNFNFNNNSNSFGLTWLWVILCFILFIIIIFAIFYPRRRYRMSLQRGQMMQQYPMMQMENLENMEEAMMEPSSDGMSPQAIMDSDRPMMVFFYAPWCGHCQRSKPEFEKLMQMARGRAFMINCDEHQDIAKAHDIQGFPTIRYYPNGPRNGNPQEYMGDRSAQNMMEFMS